MLPLLTALFLAAPPPIHIESAPRVHDAGAELRVTYVIAAQAELTAHASSDWVVRESSRSSQFSIVNGATSRSSTLTLTLVARRAGPLTLPIVSATIDGAVVRSASHVVDVSGTPKPAPPDEVSRGDAFLDWEAPPGLFVNVPTRVALCLWIREGLSLTQLTVTPPLSLSGATATPVARVDNLPGAPRRIGGVYYHRVPVLIESWRAGSEGSVTTRGGWVAVVVGGVAQRLEAPPLTLPVSTDPFFGSTTRPARDP
ncbi:MAG: BatD family protein [Myxococcales bacterium]|nr:BatD family protein [Myxococcales bacterium]